MARFNHVWLFRMRLRTGLVLRALGTVASPNPARGWTNERTEIQHMTPVLDQMFLNASMTRYLPYGQRLGGVRDRNRPSSQHPLTLSGVSKVIRLGLTMILARRTPRPAMALAVHIRDNASNDRTLAEAASTRPIEGSESRVQEVAAQVATPMPLDQARLDQALRMQALGQLASGIAHDFNNVLQAIGGALFLIAQQPDDAERVARFAAVADDAAQRGAAITGRLLSMSRKGGLRTGPVDPGLLLMEMADLLAHALGAGIAIRVDAAPGLPPLLADRGQLETVLINLATNARDAMPGGGALALSATVDARGPDGLVAPGLNGYIRIDVIDNGAGMDAMTLARASEPFFTTKEIGRGTGLGLAMALGFAEQSDGAMRIESAPGMGTTVRLWLPCAGKAASLPVPHPAAPPMPRLRGRVLLVDDDGLVRATLAEQLRTLGLDVVTACDGPAALRALAADMSIALLVSDLTMPGIDGVALIQTAQRARPELPALLVTGYAGDLAVLTLGRSISGPFSMLRKPVSAACLVDCIAALLAQRVDANASTQTKADRVGALA